MEDFSIDGESFKSFLKYLGKVLQRCVKTNLVLIERSSISWLKRVSLLDKKSRVKELNISLKGRVYCKVTSTLFVNSARSIRVCRVL